MTLWKQISFFRFEEKNTLASSSQKNRRCRISSLLLSQFLWKLPPAKGERNDFQPFSASVSIWVENGMVQPRESSCHNKALVLLLMFWHEKVTAIRSAHASLFPGHHLLLISFFLFFPNLQNTSSMSEWEVGAEGRWGVVIAMDPFLYESRHSMPHGKGSFLEGGNGFFSPPASPWGGPSVNYIQLGLCTVETRAGFRPPPTIPSSTHHQLDPERCSRLASAQRDISERE